MRPGDRVAVVAPSGPVPRDAFTAGIALLGDRYQLAFDEGLFSAAGFLAGSDARRREELCAALSDRSVRAVLLARGGYGLTRILAGLPPSLLAADPKPIAGFSDGTALHAACLSAGVASLHAANVSQLSRLADPGASVRELFDRLEWPDPPPAWDGLRSLSAGRLATGRAIGGNLEVFTRLLGTALLPPLDGAVLFLEEVTERPYRLDRELTHLHLAGVLDRVAAIVVGELVQCDEPGGALRGDDVVAERLAGLSIPVVAGAPFGHGRDNRAFPLGALVRVDAAAGRVEFLEGAVV